LASDVAPTTTPVGSQCKYGRSPPRHQHSVSQLRISTAATALDPPHAGAHLQQHENRKQYTGAGRRDDKHSEVSTTSKQPRKASCAVLTTSARPAYFTSCKLAWRCCNRAQTAGQGA